MPDSEQLPGVSYALPGSSDRKDLHERWRAGEFELWIGPLVTDTERHQLELFVPTEFDTEMAAVIVATELVPTPGALRVIGPMNLQQP